MKNRCLAALLCLAVALVAAGCGNARTGGENKRRYGSPQTGTNIPRALRDSSSTRQPRPQKERTAKAKSSQRAEKKARAEKRERRARAADDEVVTRGGFR